MGGAMCGKGLVAPVTLLRTGNFRQKDTEAKSFWRLSVVREITTRLRLNKLFFPKWRALQVKAYAADRDSRPCDGR